MSATITPSAKALDMIVPPRMESRSKTIPTTTLPITDQQRPQPPRRAPRTCKMVSAANVFKKQHKHTATKKKAGHKTRFTQELEKEMALMDGVKDGIEHARTRIMLKITHRLNEVHKSHMAAHAQAKKDDVRFLTYADTASATLCASLEQEQIESTINRNGKLIKKVTEMGKLLENFKNKIEAEKTKLNMNWKKWDEVQRDLAQLGAEVFGIDPSSSPGDLSTGNNAQAGFRQLVGEVDMELNQKIAETTIEFKQTGIESLEKMKNSEKELSAAAKKEQANILAAILEN